MSQQILFIHGGNTHDSYEEYLVYLRETQASLEKLRRRGIGQNLAERLGEGFEVIVPNMPCKQNAKYLEWKIWFEKFIPFLREGVILIGHSLGGLFLVKYLSENTLAVSVRSTLLVAAPYSSTTRRPEGLGDFVLGDDLSRFASQAGEVVIYHSHDDEIVPYSSSQKYLESIPQADLETFDDRGHFNQETFPELEDKLRELSLVS